MENISAFNSFDLLFRDLCYRHCLLVFDGDTDTLCILHHQLLIGHVIHVETELIVINLIIEGCAELGDRDLADFLFLLYHHWALVERYLDLLWIAYGPLESFGLWRTDEVILLESVAELVSSDRLLQELIDSFLRTELRKALQLVPGAHKDHRRLQLLFVVHAFLVLYNHQL